MIAPPIHAASAASPADHAAYAREHLIAQSLQQVLLRTSLRQKVAGLSLEAFYEAALAEATVGGDSFDAFVIGGGRVVLAVADASGKGLAAAERVAEIRFTLRAYLREHGDPAHALACLNDFVCNAQHMDGRECDTFATLTMVVLDGESGEAECLCAGGEPPLVLRAGGTVEAAPASGPALGLMPGQGYTTATISLSAGDSILLATDGITEARKPSEGKPGRHGPFLGIEGLGQIAIRKQDASMTLAQVGRSIFDSARHYAGGAFHDDACLLIGRREGS